MQDRFPLIDFSLWETYALNEFLNHQLARNTVFVEVERHLEESAFYALKEHFDAPVLLMPSMNELFLYAGELTIVIIRLTTEAPVLEHASRIEKLLVDLYANNLVKGIMSPAEIPGIYETAMSRYHVNYCALMRYARRRGVDKRVQERIGDD
jgi:hypothetical protein